MADEIDLGDEDEAALERAWEKVGPAVKDAGKKPAKPEAPEVEPKAGEKQGE